MSDRRLENRVLIWVCLLVGVNQLGFGAIVPVLPQYAQSFGVSVSAIGMATGIYGLARFLLAAPAGGMADRFGRRRALALGGLATAAGNLWCAYASSYPEFLTARFLAGAGAGLIVTTGQIVLADISPIERRGRILSIYMSAFVFSVGIGPLPGGVLAEHFGLAAPFIGFAVAGSLSGLLSWFAIPETSHMAHAAAAQVPGIRPSYGRQVQALGRQPGFVLACLVNLMNTAARTGGLFSIVPLIGASRLGMSVQDIGIAMALGLVIGLVAAYPSGVLVDYFGRKAVIVPATIASGTALLLFCIADSPAGYIAASLVWGLASSIGGSAPTAYAADAAPPGMNATTLSLFRMIGDFGYVVGPILMGVVADLAGANAALEVMAATMVVVAVLFAWIAPETYRRRGTG